MSQLGVFLSTGTPRTIPSGRKKALSATARSRMRNAAAGSDSQRSEGAGNLSVGVDLEREGKK